MRYLFLLLLLSSGQSVFSQDDRVQTWQSELTDHMCGTPAISYEERKEGLKAGIGKNLKNNGMTQLPIRAHIVTLDNGSGGLSLTDLNQALANLNHVYHEANIEWFLADVNYIASTTHYDYNTANENSLCTPHEVDDAVNVFFVNSINGNGICGYAYYPSNSDISLRILMRNSCTNTYLNGTFVHEFGHHWSLPHTHQYTQNGNGAANAEHVPRSGPQSNCSTAGDFICDTEADPQGQVNSACQYTSGGTDIYGNPYTPPVDNIMSYYWDACGGIFTPGQYTEITAGLNARLAHTAYDIDGAGPQTVSDPSGLSIVNNSTSLTLNWNDNANNEEGYLIERSSDGGATYRILPFGGTGANVTSFVDNNIQPGTEYKYRVKASNDNPDHYSNVVTFTTDQCVTEPLVFNGGQLQQSPFILDGLPASLPSCMTEACVTVKVVGDFGDTWEICDVLGEDGSTVLGQHTTSPSDCDAAGGTADFCLTVTQYNNWAGNGSITLYISANNNVGDFCSSNTVTGCIEILDCGGGGNGGGGNCPSDYAGANQLTGIQGVTEIFETDGLIESDQLILPAVDVNYDSGASIELLPGFEVSIGADFEAIIDGCN